MAPELRKRKADGTVNLGTSSAKRKDKPKTQAKAAATKKSSNKASPKKKTAASAKPSTKSGVSKKATSKSSPKKAASAPPKKTGGSTKSAKAKKTDDGEQRAIDRRKWFVWPPYTYVHEIPDAHVDNYKRVLSNWPYGPGDSGPKASLRAQQFPVLQSDQDPAKAQRCIGWRARYVSDFVCPKTGKYRFRCDEEGWEGTHASGKEVWIAPKDMPIDMPVNQRIALERGEKWIYLGYILNNNVEGEWGMRDHSGRRELNSTLKGYGERNEWDMRKRV